MYTRLLTVYKSAEIFFSFMVAWVTCRKDNLAHIQFIENQLAEKVGFVGLFSTCKICSCSWEKLTT
jgi:hypothetical protein